MVYYKLIRDSTVIGVGTTENLRKHQIKHNILINSGEKDAQYLEAEDVLYRDGWMKEMTGDIEMFPYEEVKIVPIIEEDYNKLKEAYEAGEQLDAEIESIRNDEAEEPEEAETEAGEITVELVRSNKIKEMSLACSKTIKNGFDLELSDGTYHFSMTLQDQANLNAAYVEILSGKEEIPYHADGNDLKLFSVDDMEKIISGANDHKTYNLAYFNSLRNWLNALIKISTIENVEYGSTIPKKYQTALLKKYLSE